MGDNSHTSSPSSAQTQLAFPKRQGCREMETITLETGVRVGVPGRWGSVDPNCHGPARGGEPVCPRGDGSAFSVEDGERKFPDGSMETNQ